MNEHEHQPELTEPEMKEAQHRSSATARVVHEAVRREGEDELKRTSMALAWSGLAAGLSMGFSLILEGILRSHLPGGPAMTLISKFGYSAGFVIVILGRQQLFTENTLTAVLPLLDQRDKATARNVVRLWVVVLIANLVGALAIASVMARTEVFAPEVRQAFGAIGMEALQNSFGLAFLRGIFAGWLLALLVWLLPFAEHARFFVIIGIAWMIGVCSFTHVVAGAVEVFFAAASGLAPWHNTAGYIIPALLGNIVGGIALVSALNHAQVVS
ncbi:MAG TPA: formate/nitrite transporter family protein [Bryobacteraceae bacterium]|nr:formate/nitrite transporter family protein [Bryobacteraceae bacterium]